MNAIPVMINGLPGKVAGVMAEATFADTRFVLVPFSLTGEDIPQTETVIGDIDITLVKPSAKEKMILKILEDYPGVISVDYTHPTAVNANALFYTAHQMPFVMGTTGGDRQALEETVKKAESPAVIAPNMAKEIVGLQAMVEYGAKTFPGLFKGYSLKVTESHQQSKADTSGTAKALVACFQKLGTDFEISQIEKIRDPQIQQERLGIAQEHLGGHGWHTYTLAAPDGSALFELTHNINGRQIYVSGTLDAVVFLYKKTISQTNDPTNGPEADKKLFTMIDVLSTPA